MKTRVITAAVMVAVLIPFFIFSDTVAFPILMAFFAAIGIFELYSCIGAKKRLFALIPTMLLASVMPFVARYVKDNALSFFFLIAFSLITYTFIVSVFSKKKLTVDIAAIGAAGSVYLSFGFSSVVLLRDLDHGEWIYFLAFIIPWMTDTFAYFTGRALGKHKLIPEVSPKKTVEGAIGGTISAIIITLLYGFLVGKFTSAVPNYIGIAVVSAVGSVLSQCGDLMMSLIKRKFEIKDYGKLFPGHGGVLDRFDSIICTAPFIYFLTEFVPFLTLFK